MAKAVKKAAGKKTPGKKGTRKAVAVGENSNELFKELSEKLSGTAPSPYRMSGDYAVNAAIEHPKFGLGFVFAAAPARIDVAFNDANRALVHNRK
jgi:hypothetical protein